MAASWASRVVVKQGKVKRSESRVSPRAVPALCFSKVVPPVQTEAVEAAVRGCVQSIIGTAVALSTPLMEAGVDSLGATELQRGLSEQLSTEFEATLLFDHPSIDSIVSCYTASGAAMEGAAGVSLTTTAGSALEEAQIRTTEAPGLASSEWGTNSQV